MSPIRKEFEKWMNATHFNRASLEHYENGYFDSQTQLAWNAWQVAWAKAYERGRRVGMYLARKKRK